MAKISFLEMDPMKYAHFHQNFQFLCVMVGMIIYWEWLSRHWNREFEDNRRDLKEFCRNWKKEHQERTNNGENICIILEFKFFFLFSPLPHLLPPPSPYLTILNSSDTGTKKICSGSESYLLSVTPGQGDWGYWQ